MLPAKSRFRRWLFIAILALIGIGPIGTAIYQSFSIRLGSPSSVLFEASTNAIAFLCPAITALLVLPDFEALIDNNAVSVVGYRRRLSTLLRRGLLQSILWSFGAYFVSIYLAGLLGYLILRIRAVPPDGYPSGWGGDMSNLFTNLSSLHFLRFLVIYALWLGLQAGVFSMIAISVRLLVVQRWVAYVAPTVIIFALTIVMVVSGLSDFAPQKALGPMIALPLEPWQYGVILGAEAAVALGAWLLVEYHLPTVKASA